MNAKLSKFCHAVLMRGAKATGGTSVSVKLKTPKDWCEYYGVSVIRGIAIVYKAVNEDFSSERDATFKYVPGTTPKADMFDANDECGPGLHFSPSPKMAKFHFHNGAKKFVACPVLLSEMVVHLDGNYPHKCKAPHLAKPCWEVDENGDKI
jgi:hypothetical protein